MLALTHLDDENEAQSVSKGAYAYSSTAGFGVAESVFFLRSRL